MLSITLENFFVDGDHLQDALELAQGVNKAYENVDSVEIHRLNYEETKLGYYSNQLDSNPALRRGDGIIVVGKGISEKRF